MSETKIPMHVPEVFRKLAQLHPILDVSTQERTLELEEIATSDLSHYLTDKDGNIDVVRLVPFLLTAVNSLQERVVFLESKLNQ